MIEMKPTAALLAATLVLGAESAADAHGCIKGAVVGGVVGHVAHHHALLGAAAGCAIGHHLAAKHERERHMAQERARHMR
jgi:hypothetical protein